MWKDVSIAWASVARGSYRGHQKATCGTARSRDLISPSMDSGGTSMPTCACVCACACRQVMSCHVIVISCYVMLHQVILHHIISYHITSCYIISHHITSHHVIVISCHITSQCVIAQYVSLGTKQHKMMIENEGAYSEHRNKEEMIYRARRVEQEGREGLG